MTEGGLLLVGHLLELSTGDRIISTTWLKRMKHFPGHPHHHNFSLPLQVPMPAQSKSILQWVPHMHEIESVPKIQGDLCEGGGRVPTPHPPTLHFHSSELCSHLAISTLSGCPVPQSLCHNQVRASPKDPLCEQRNGGLPSGPEIFNSCATRIFATPKPDCLVKGIDLFP